MNKKINDILEDLNNNNIDVETAKVQLQAVISDRLSLLASEEGQQDWSSLLFKETYVNGFKDSTKFVLQGFE